MEENESRRKPFRTQLRKLPLIPDILFSLMGSTNPTCGSNFFVFKAPVLPEVVEPSPQKDYLHGAVKWLVCHFSPLPEAPRQLPVGCQGNRQFHPSAIAFFSIPQHRFWREKYFRSKFDLCVQKSTHLYKNKLSVALAQLFINLQFFMETSFIH